MNKRNYLLILVVGLLFFALSAAGCGDSSGGGEYFDTVRVTVDSGAPSLDSDVATWMDADGDGLCDSYAVSPDDVDFTVASEVHPDTPGYVNPSKVRVENVNIRYTPANIGTPELSDQNYALGQFVDPDGSVTIPVTVVSQSQKGSSPLDQIVVFGGTYTYHVRVSFSCVEVDTGTRQSPYTDLTIDVADFMTDSEECNF